MQTRRKFIGNVSKVAVGVCLYPSIISKKQIVDNPYENIDWKKIMYVPSTSHIHIGSQDKLNKVYNQFGLRHLPISNYYPSTPYYPADMIYENQFRIKQNFAVMRGKDFTVKTNEKWLNNKLQQEPIDWNSLIMNNKDWFNSLDYEQKKELPFKLGGKVFNNIPQDLIISPNAEHHGFTNTSLHANSLGSLFSSGTFDAHNKFKTLEHGYFYGTGLLWEDAFKKMLDQLLFKDGGGITLNHPVWSSLSLDEVYRMLDFDNRVLGIEIFNDTCVTAFGDPVKGWATKLWDEILSSNRRCLGFCVPDHTLGKGRNVLLVPKQTEHECLKAYQKGAFFGALNGDGFQFNKITFVDNVLRAEVNKNSQLLIITDKGLSKRISGTEIDFKVSPNDGFKFVRVEAVDETSNQLFSQPIRFL